MSALEVMMSVISLQPHIHESDTHLTHNDATIYMGNERTNHAAEQQRHGKGRPVVVTVLTGTPDNQSQHTITKSSHETITHLSL
jgi:hypothetical protein